MTSISDKFSCAYCKKKLPEDFFLRRDNGDLWKTCKLCKEVRDNSFCKVDGCGNEKLFKRSHHGTCAEHGGELQIFRQLVPRNYIGDTQERKFKDIPEKEKVTVEFIQELYEKQNGLCHYCGIPVLVKRGNRGLDNISIDRIDSDGKYEKSNVVISCCFCNAGKNKSYIGDFVNTMNIVFSDDHSQNNFHEVVPTKTCWTNNVTKYTRKKTMKTCLGPEVRRSDLQSLRIFVVR